MSGRPPLRACRKDAGIKDYGDYSAGGLTRRGRGRLIAAQGRARPASADAIMNKPEKNISGEPVDHGHLRAFIERIERLEEEKRAIADDIKAVYAEAKGNGFDAKVMRKVVSLRRMDRDKRIEEETILDLYLSALGDA